MKKLLIAASALIIAATVRAQSPQPQVSHEYSASGFGHQYSARDQGTGSTLVYLCKIDKMIAAPLWRSVKKSFAGG